MTEEMSEKLKQTEEDMEQEKEKLVHELSRGKAAAVALLQVCTHTPDTLLYWEGRGGGRERERQRVS